MSFYFYIFAVSPGPPVGLRLLETRGPTRSRQLGAWPQPVQPASEKIFLIHHFWLTWGDIKQDITVFITAIMTYKRLCQPAPNDYNIGLCDYCGYGETETVIECHFWVLVTVYYINVA